MALKTVSVDSGTPEQIYAHNREMERHWPAFADPLDILIRWETLARSRYHLDDYDDPMVDRQQVSYFINNRLYGDQNNVR